MFNLTNIFDLIDVWRQKHPSDPGFTWTNSSMKIQCRLDYFFSSKSVQHLVSECQIVSNIFSDHSALQLTLNAEEKEAKRGLGFWKFNNSFLADKEYIDLITKNVPTICI